MMEVEVENYLRKDVNVGSIRKFFRFVLDFIRFVAFIIGFVAMIIIPIGLCMSGGIAMGIFVFMVLASILFHRSK